MNTQFKLSSKIRTTVSDIKLINLPKIEDPRGSLSIIEEENHIPFKIARAYWIYDVPGGQSHGGHAFIQQQEFIVALSGSFDVTLDDGNKVKTFSLNRSYYGLYIPHGIWRRLDNFSTNSLAIILSSSLFKEEDCIRDYQKFLKFKEL